MGLVLGCLLVLTGCGSPANAGDEGKEAFVSNKCNRCHAVASQGIPLEADSKKARGSDLSQVGAARDADWLRRYIRKEVQLEGKDHVVAWKGSDAELEALVTWLDGLGSP
jgi:cytochrome c5